MTTVAVVGLGYVGLPLAVEFGKKYRTVGFDLSETKGAGGRPRPAGMAAERIRGTGSPAKSKTNVRCLLPTSTASGRPT